MVHFITYSGEPHISPDDAPLAKALEELGLRVTAFPWDLENPQPASPGIFVNRSPWNYDSAPDEFLRRLECLERSGHHLINSYSLVRWNIHKRYLLEVAGRGLAIPQTALVPAGAAELDSLCRAFANHEHVVLKPAISLSAHHTSRIQTTRIAEHASRLQLTGREYIIQEFIPEIASGELSFVFLGGQCSHCIRKTPEAGDFRTQSDFGAGRERYQPASDEIAAAARYLALAPELPVFARVDLVRRGSALLLMELELIDPMLFFTWAPGSERRLAGLIAEAATAIH